MRIGFFCQGTGIHWEIAKNLITSVRLVMPDVELVHFTDGDTPGLTKEVRRIVEPMPMAMRRMKHHAQCDGDWLFCDTDVIFKRDVRDVFDEPFDVAVTDRIGTYMDGTEYARMMPYNMGVTFSRNGKFWDLVIEKLLQYPKALQEWEGDQRVVCDLAQNQNTPFDIVVLPGATYNFTPKTQDEIVNAAIVHYKGRRKAWV